MDRVHPSIQALAVEAVRAVPGLDVAGVDLILSRGYEIAVDDQEVVVIEVNAGAALQSSLSPTSGPAVNVFRSILEDLAEDAAVDITEPERTHVVALSFGFTPVPRTELVDMLDATPHLSVEVPPLKREDVLILDGPTVALRDALIRLGEHVNTVTAASLSVHHAQGPSWLDQVLQPSVFLPNDHCAVLAREHA